MDALEFDTPLLFPISLAGGPQIDVDPYVANQVILNAQRDNPNDMIARLEQIREWLAEVLSVAPQDRARLSLNLVGTFCDAISGLVIGLEEERKKKASEIVASLLATRGFQTASTNGPKQTRQHGLPTFPTSSPGGEYTKQTMTEEQPAPLPSPS